jgi:hypothetical protein
MKSVESARMTVIHNMIEQKTKRRNTYFTRIFRSAKNIHI